MLVNTKVIHTEGDLGGEKIAMGVDENSLVHIMSLLSDLYSDKIMAVIREYSTNALDSHLASGQTRPVEISSPTALNPYFQVQDFGVGMDADDIRNIYSKYGASSKRSNNIESGMLGLGCKSGLTFSNQFILTGIKNGVKTLVSISRSADGAGQMEVVSISDTTEPNGVTIKVPVNSTWDRKEFDTKIKKFASFVTPGSLLVDGQPYADKSWVKVSDRFWLRPSDWSDYNNYVVMGNVAYPLPANRLTPEDDDGTGVDNIIPWNHTFAYFADMGTVDFPPSREELMYTDKTLATIETIIGSFKAEFDAYLEREIDQCESFAKAFTRRADLSNKYHLKLSDLTYRGQNIPVYINTRYASWDLEFKERSSSKQTKLHVAPVDHLVIHNWTSKSFTTVHGRKITGYLKENHKDWDDNDDAYLLETLVHEEIFENCLVLDWNDVKKFKVATNKRGPKAKRAWYNHNRQRVVPDDTKTIYYAYRDEVGEGALQQLVLTGSEVYLVPPSQQKKFLELNPTAKHVQVGINSVIVDWVNGLKPEDYDAFKLQTDFHRADVLDMNQILDPELKEIVKANLSNDNPQQSELFRKRNQMLNLWYSADQAALKKQNIRIPDVQYLGKHVVGRYPLLNVIDTYQYRYSNEKYKLMQHLTEYVNTIYLKEYSNG